MATPAALTTLREHLRSSSRILLKEISAFGAIGLVSLVIDVSLFNLLSHKLGQHSPLKAKAISTVVATTFAYFGNRYLSFSHRARTSLSRETTYFFVINLITLVIGEAIIALFAYPLDQRTDDLVMNVVNLATIGIGTVFRFWAYKRFVFLHPDRVHDADVDLETELAE